MKNHTLSTLYRDFGIIHMDQLKFEGRVYNRISKKPEEQDEYQKRINIVTFRNDDEQHTVKIYYAQTAEKIVYVHAYYSIE